MLDSAYFQQSCPRQEQSASLAESALSIINSNGFFQENVEHCLEEGFFKPEGKSRKVKGSSKPSCSASTSAVSLNDMNQFVQILFWTHKLKSLDLYTF